MTNKNNTTTKISRPVFLAYVLENFGDQMPEEYRAVGETWHGKLTTKPAKGEPTKTQRENAVMVARVADAIRDHGESVTARWVLENVDGILTIQKASAIMRTGVRGGTFVADTNKKVTEYSVA